MFKQNSGANRAQQLVCHTAAQLCVIYTENHKHQGYELRYSRGLYYTCQVMAFFQDHDGGTVIKDCDGWQTLVFVWVFHLFFSSSLCPFICQVVFYHTPPFVFFLSAHYLGMHAWLSVCVCVCVSLTSTADLIL